MRLLHFVYTIDYVKWLFFECAKVGKGWLSIYGERKLSVVVFFFIII